MPYNLANACAVLVANDNAKEGSFVHALHERDVFDQRTFWTLYEAMAVIAEAHPRTRGRETRRMAVHVHTEILMHVIYHLNPHDSSRIDGFPDGTIYDWLYRLKWVFNPVVLGTAGYGPAKFGDGLEAPRGGHGQR